MAEAVERFGIGRRRLHVLAQIAETVPDQIVKLRPPREPVGGRQFREPEMDHLADPVRLP